MPTYSYRCTECSEAFDVFQAFTDDSLTVCPTCAGKLRKVFSAIGVTFTGSGFYSTDSKASKSTASVPGKSSGTDAGSSSSSSGSGSGSDSGGSTAPAAAGTGSGAGPGSSSASTSASTSTSTSSAAKTPASSSS
ncbi:MAG: FmdB family transcriptional regulator [Microbacteriaceae bacterium]|nr:FmdB family transcriptional regulator [Microbacteriaceae bacterium]